MPRKARTVAIALGLTMMMGGRGSAALNVYLSIQGFAKIEIRELNRDFAKICSFKAMTAELGPDAARQLLGKAKKGDKLGEGRLDGDPDRPYRYALHDLVVRNVLERDNGTARVTFAYGRCEQLR